MKKKNQLARKRLVVEGFLDKGLIQVEVYQLVAVNLLHHVKVIVQQASQWQDKIPLLGYLSFMEKGWRTQRIIYLSRRIFGQPRRL
jgi:hypothetical protein